MVISISEADQIEENEQKRAGTKNSWLNRFIGACDSYYSAFAFFPHFDY
jgi:hypothetical protein